MIHSLSADERIRTSICYAELAAALAPASRQLHGSDQKTHIMPTGYLWPVLAARDSGSRADGLVAFGK
jgi:hypothetical protein